MAPKSLSPTEDPEVGLSSGGDSVEVGMRVLVGVGGRGFSSRIEE